MEGKMAANAFGFEEHSDDAIDSMFNEIKTTLSDYNQCHLSELNQRDCRIRKLIDNLETEQNLNEHLRKQLIESTMKYENVIHGYTRFCESVSKSLQEMSKNNDTNVEIDQKILSLSDTGKVSDRAAQQVHPFGSNNMEIPKQDTDDMHQLEEYQEYDNDETMTIISEPKAQAGDISFYHQNPKIKCMYCEERFFSKDSLRFHLRIYHYTVDEFY